MTMLRQPGLNIFWSLFLTAGPFLDNWLLAIDFSCADFPIGLSNWKSQIIAISKD
jgi:hypothetical protein